MENSKKEKLYSLDEIYKRAEDAAHLSPELKAKDEALWELANYIKQHGGENPYAEADHTGASAEEIIDQYIEHYDLMPMFNEQGSIVTLNELWIDLEAEEHSVDEDMDI